MKEHDEMLRILEEITKRLDEISKLFAEIEGFKPKNIGSYKNISDMWHRLMAEEKEKEKFTYNPKLFRYDFGEDK